MSNSTSYGLDMVKWEEIEEREIVSALQHWYQLFQQHHFWNLEKAMFHMSSDICIILFLCATKTNIFANISRIALNFTVHKDEYNSTTEIMR